MSVGIAAICKYKESHLILGASDRMLTSEGTSIEYETSQAKSFKLIEEKDMGCIAVIAGDDSPHSIIYNDVLSMIKSDRPKTILMIANIYAQAYRKLRLERAKVAILEIIGLNLSDLKNLNADLRRELIKKMSKYEIGVETIVTGVDSTGAHIYTIKHPGNVECHDIAGFVAIGTGWEQAESQFMFQGYTPEYEAENAILMVYMAKKYAEVVAGVGKETDCFGIEPGISYMSPKVYDKVNKIYSDFKDKEKEARESAYKEINKFVKEALQKTQGNQEGNAIAPPGSVKA